MPEQEYLVTGLQEEEEEGKIQRQESFEFLTPNLNSHDLVWPVFSHSIKMEHSKTVTRPSPIRHDRGYSEKRRRLPPWYWPASPAAEIKLRNGAKIRKQGSRATEKASCEPSTWRLINALSCKSHGSVAATTPFHPYC